MDFARRIDGPQGRSGLPLCRSARAESAAIGKLTDALLLLEARQEPSSLPIRPQTRGSRRPALKPRRSHHDVSDPTPFTSRAGRGGGGRLTGIVASIAMGCRLCVSRHLKLKVIVVWDEPLRRRGTRPPIERGTDARSSDGASARGQPVSRDRWRVVQGDPAKMLESVSDGAALLVVAQRGHGEVVGMLLGSVSEHCVAHANVLCSCTGMSRRTPAED